LIVYERLFKTLMYAHQRQQRVIDLLKERSSLSVPELGALLSASPATVRRDLGFLEEAGRIVRTHGGVVAADRRSGEASFSRKSRRELAAKRSIAEAAAALVADGDAVFVDAGTTAFKVGARLLKRPGVTVYTNSIPLLNEAATAAGRLVAVGGEVRAVSQALVGAPALDWLNRLRFDLAFIGASGIDPGGPCTTELGEAGVKGAAIRGARRAVLVADVSKWELAAPIVFSFWSEFDDVITDRRLSPAERETLTRHRIRVHPART
jgi:DeoR/GlpR family transcriptional regulator of sugar metabolism